MSDSNISSEINKRRTFAIISHPDAGKTTLTEKLLLFGGAIQLAGAVKGRKASRHATSDWMKLEQQRGISVTSSVMQFAYRDCIVNLLDTPGHADFSEDTYRTLTAVDSALMVVDSAKGVEERTIKLMEICRLRDTPIFTFINKLDREGLEPIDLLDEIERILTINCAPITWPIGMGQHFRGVYHLYNDQVRLFSAEHKGKVAAGELIQGLDNPLLDEQLGQQARQLRDDIELVKGASHEFNISAYLAGELTPVYFGSAMHNFGIDELLDDFVQYAPAPLPRAAGEQIIEPTSDMFSGFVFKIQANMDPNHHDRMAFLRICSGSYRKGMKVCQTRTGKDIKLNDALTFMAAERDQVELAYAGDIIGLHNHGAIRIGDTFSNQQRDLRFRGIPNFAPELFRRVVLKDPLRLKALQKGLIQLSEEGATQFFRPLLNNDWILGAVGILQFDVVAYRLQTEYKVQCQFATVNVHAARWVECADTKQLEDFKRKLGNHLALDHADELVYIAPSRVNLQMTIERWPDIAFAATREQSPD